MSNEPKSFLTLDTARTLADTIRGAYPEKAAEVEAAIAQSEAEKKDGVNISVGIGFRLEKFHGAPKAGDKPYEVIEGSDQG